MGRKRFRETALPSKIRAVREKSLLRRTRSSSGYNYDLTSIRRPFDCLCKVIKVTLTSRAGRGHAELGRVQQSPPSPPPQVGIRS